MPLFITCKDTKFGVGDRIRVTKRLTEGDKARKAIFEGVVISIKGGLNPAFVVRRIGEQNISIERIFPLFLPSIEKVEVLKKGTSGVKHAKLYYLRRKSPREVDRIYSLVLRKGTFTQTKGKVKSNRLKNRLM